MAVKESLVSRHSLPLAKIKNIPDRCGVYLMKDKGGRVIYIGKAVALKKRLLSYFSKQYTSIKQDTMLSKVDSIDYILTDAETEALILESSLIKKNKPKYNVSLKDDKNYPLVKITQMQDFARIFIVRRRLNDGSVYFGPYTNAKLLRGALKGLREIFPYRTCRRSLNPKGIGLTKPSKEGLNPQDRPSYSSKKEGSNPKGIPKRAQVGLTKPLTLKGRPSQYILGRGLKEGSNPQDRPSYSSKKEGSKNPCLNFDLGLCSAPCAGKISKKEYSQNIANICLFLEGRNKQLLNEISEQMSVYAKQHNFEKAKVLRDRIDALSSMTGGFSSYKMELSALKNILHLKRSLKRIEAFDVSSISQDNVVGSMVSFVDGRPDKNNYRRFRIKGDRLDDCSAIAEVVRRRYKRIVSAGISLPDLIIIDGGKGQLSSAARELEALELKIPIISIAKTPPSKVSGGSIPLDKTFPSDSSLKGTGKVYPSGSKVSGPSLKGMGKAYPLGSGGSTPLGKREEKIFRLREDRPLQLNLNSKALNLIRRIRDEAHRFAISYHRLLRKKKIIGK